MPALVKYFALCIDCATQNVHQLELEYARQCQCFVALDVTILYSIASAIVPSFLVHELSWTSMKAAGSCVNRVLRTPVRLSRATPALMKYFWLCIIGATQNVHQLDRSAIALRRLM